ncbi:galactokinase [Mumia zhuanghuii]|uniref:Galactokinase n=1 Tax=Mumia zhuanghuii TaxID=2585211 RepID=A0A5C4MJX4_9ACTN|nr:galactokinase [Mumia zhuanghuii]TNC36499.1 galactokinase [Mumia zhuanghuii]TNC44977.1 galactokinase [Mumia zhuanghuii]
MTAPQPLAPGEIGTWAAPGRVNLIGEHLDYVGGPVMPIAIDLRTTVKVRRRDDGKVRVWSAISDGSVEFDATTTPGDVSGWARYVAGTVWALAQSGRTTGGADLVVSSDVPLGAGLSSSAALECSVAVALAGAEGWEIDPIALALTCQRAENEYVGAPTGSMDQLASMCGEVGHALLIETAPTPPTVRAVPAHWVEDGYALVVVDTQAKHSLATGEYGVRRAQTEELSALLGVEQLASAPPDSVLKVEDPVLKARLRHVITETQRVRSAARALSARDWRQLGQLMTASHASLRDDYDVSAPELDLTVETVLEHGAIGARMTGGGFGGSAIALVEAERVGALTEAVAAAFARVDFKEPRTFVVSPAGGATRLS